MVGCISEHTFISTATGQRSVPQPAASFAARLAAHHWTPLPVVPIAPFMVVLDFFIVNVAIPSMQSRLHAGSGPVEWVIAGYGLTFAIGLITGGRLGDRFGRRRMFSLGLLLFTIASAACGLASTPSLLVGARIAQGLAAALLMPQPLAILGVIYDGARHVEGAWRGRRNLSQRRLARGGGTLDTPLELPRDRPLLAQPRHGPQPRRPARA